MRDRWGNSLQALVLLIWLLGHADQNTNTKDKYKRQMQNAKFSSIGSYSRQWARGYSVCALYLYVQTYVLGWVGCPRICLVQLWMGRLYILANIYFEMGMLPSPMFGAAWDGYVVRPWPNSCLLSVWGLSGIGHGTAHSHSAILPCHQHQVKEKNNSNNNTEN